MVQVPIGNVNTPVAFDANAVELFARAGMRQFGLIGGFTYLEPDVQDPLLDPDFKTAYLILGGEWFVARTVSVRLLVQRQSPVALARLSASGGRAESLDSGLSMSELQ